MCSFGRGNGPSDHMGGQRRVAAEKQAHIDGVMADRQVGVRGNHTSEIDASRANGDGMGQMVKTAIDGMDQAKFKVPRNLKSSAELSSLWRPALHVVGCLAFGHVEAYYIMNSDQTNICTHGGHCGLQGP